MGASIDLLCVDFCVSFLARTLAKYLHTHTHTHTGKTRILPHQEFSFSFLIFGLAKIPAPTLSFLQRKSFRNWSSNCAVDSPWFEVPDLRSACFGLAETLFVELFSAANCLQLFISPHYLPMWQECLRLPQHVCSHSYLYCFLSLSE